MIGLTYFGTNNLVWGYGHDLSAPLFFLEPMKGESTDNSEEEQPPCLGELSLLPCAFPFILGNVTLTECTDANNGNGRLPGRTWCPLLVNEDLEPYGEPGTHSLAEGT